MRRISYLAMHPLENDLKKAFHHILNEMSDEQLLAAVAKADAGVLHKFRDPIFCETVSSVNMRFGFQPAKKAPSKFPSFAGKELVKFANYNEELALAA